MMSCALPPVLLVHPLEETEILHTVINKLVTVLTTMGNLDVLLYKEGTSVEPTEFLNTAMTLNDNFPAMPDQVRQMDRLITSTSKGKPYSAWLVQTNHKLRTGHRAPSVTAAFGLPKGKFSSRRSVQIHT